MSAVVEKAKEQNVISEVKEICDEHLAHSKNSIIALYLSGMLGLKLKSLDNSALSSLVTIFVDNHKNSIVIFLCKAILEEEETNKFALRTLADAYKEENAEAIWEVYEQIVRIDYEEADIAKLLAEQYEKEGKRDDAIDYYKSASSLCEQKSVNQLKEMWTKLVELIPEEIDFSILYREKLQRL